MCANCTILHNTCDQQPVNRLIGRLMVHAPLLYTYVFKFHKENQKSFMPNLEEHSIVNCGNRSYLMPEMSSAKIYYRTKLKSASQAVIWSKQCMYGDVIQRIHVLYLSWIVLLQRYIYNFLLFITCQVCRSTIMWNLK